jgi:hypothetical protein
MSNYIDNLIARNFAKAEVLRPRLASRYEPLRKIAEPVVDESRFADTVDAAGLYEDFGDADARGKHHFEEAEPAKADWQPDDQKPSDRLRDTVWRGEQKLPKPKSPSAEFSTSEIQAKLPPPFSAQENLSHGVEPTTANLRALPNSISATALNPATPSRELRPPGQKAYGEPPEPPVQDLIGRAEPSNAGKNTPVQTKIVAANLLPNSQADIRNSLIRRPVKQEAKASSRVESSLAPISTTAELRPSKVMVEPQMAFRSRRQTAAFDWPAGFEPKEQAAPTINVTIGRIEVRATQTGAPTRKPQTAAPALSLEDYLRKRNEGGKA